MSWRQQAIADIQAAVQSQINLSPFRHLHCSSHNSNNNDGVDRERRISLATFQIHGSNNSSNPSALNSLEMNNLINMRSEYYELFDALTQTMTGEGSTCILLVGKHGYGKSSILQFALHQLMLKFGKGSFLEIYLNGVQHTNDVQAL